MRQVEVGRRKVEADRRKGCGSCGRPGNVRQVRREEEKQGKRGKEGQLKRGKK